MGGADFRLPGARQRVYITADPIDPSQTLPTGSLLPNAMKGLAAYLVIGMGSALGGWLRYACDLLGAALWGLGFPWSTILINILGSFVIGLFAALTGPDGRIFIGSLARQFVMLGICGGYTTFSAFSIQTLDLLRAGRALAAGANVALSLALCLLAVWIGHVLAQRLNA
jgi:fluoride exporter